MADALAKRLTGLGAGLTVAAGRNGQDRSLPHKRGFGTDPKQNGLAHSVKISPEKLFARLQPKIEEVITGLLAHDTDIYEGEIGNINYSFSPFVEFSSGGVAESRIEVRTKKYNAK